MDKTYKPYEITDISVDNSDSKVNITIKEYKCIKSIQTKIKIK